MLHIKSLTASYGLSQILFGVDLNIKAGECVALVGRNGMGKTTAIHSVFGICRPSGGSIRFADQEILGWPSPRIARLGLGLVPEGRRIFPTLTVRENLIATAANFSRSGTSWTYDRVLELFPSLKTRLRSYGNQLSGGEQQMLAIGRALMLNPRLLVLDEATEGLAPRIRDQIWNCLIHLKSSGLSILIVDKNVDALSSFADSFFVLRKGQVVWNGTTQEFRRDTALIESYLGVSGSTA